MDQKVIVTVRFGGSLRYRMRQETSSPLFVDLSFTTHV